MGPGTGLDPKCVVQNPTCTTQVVKPLVNGEWPTPLTQGQAMKDMILGCRPPGSHVILTGDHGPCHIHSGVLHVPEKQ